MTNEAVSAILDYLCMEARNSMHAIFGYMELASNASTRRESPDVGRGSADQLLRTIDDLRELASDVPPAPAALEDLDLGVLAGEVTEVLTLAAERQRHDLILELPFEPLPLTQDRRAIEQILTRVLKAALKLSCGNDVYLRLSPAPVGVRLAIYTANRELATRLIGWLRSPLDSLSSRDPEDMLFGVPVMVAGKRLRALGGSCDEIVDAQGERSVVLDLPSQALRDEAGSGMGEKPLHGLNVLVAEDCDDSFFLTELMLEGENVQRAHDGFEALSIVQKQRFDVVLMDIHMPGMDGYSVIRNIRDWETQTGNARTALVILSSDDLETQRRSAAEAGCSGFLRKPLRKSDLQRLMDSLKSSRTCAA